MASAKTVVASALNRGGELLGHLIYWRLEDARIEAKTFEAVWTGAGLDPKYLPELPSPERALRDAGAAAMRGQEHHLWRLAAKTSTHIIYAIVEEQPDGKGDVSYRQEAQVSVDGAGQTASDHPEHPLVGAVVAHFGEVWGSYQHRDVVNAILAVLKDCASVTLREGGGIYFVPNPHKDKVAALVKAIGQVGSSEVTALPITQDAERQASAALGQAAKGSIERELADLRVEMDTFTESILAGGEGNPRASTIERRLALFEEIRGKANLYRDVLAVNVADLDDKIAALEEQGQTILAVLEAPPAANGGEQPSLPA